MHSRRLVNSNVQRKPPLAACVGQRNLVKKALPPLVNAYTIYPWSVNKAPIARAQVETYVTAATYLGQHYNKPPPWAWSSVNARTLVNQTYPWCLDNARSYVRAFANQAPTWLAHRPWLTKSQGHSIGQRAGSPTRLMKDTKVGD